MSPISIFNPTSLWVVSSGLLIFRGEVRHQVNIPLLLGLLPGVPFTEEVYGPTLMYFGDLVRIPLKPNGQTLNSVGGPFQRLGFNDNNPAHLLLQLVEKQALPDLTLAYFPDNDIASLCLTLLGIEPDFSMGISHIQD